MRVADLQNLYDYTYWANSRLFPVLSQLTPEQFTESVAGSYGSVRNTLVHVLSAEWGWLDRCGGHPRGPLLNPDDFPTVETLVDQWKKVEGYVREFLSTLTDDDLDRVVDYSFNPSQPHSQSVGNLMQHAVIHAVHHRGQVAMLLRLLGHTPGNFDFLYYNEENRGD
jgi:uncharacterized damage-inducible protein DinB